MTTWLEAWNDPLAGIRARSRHICLVDVDANGESALVVADLSRRLRVFRNTGQVQEVALMEVPTAITSYYMDQHPASKPAVVVAAGPSLYIYRGMAPFIKFTLPPLDVEAAEQQYTVVTTVTVLRKSMEDDTAVGCLVIGTEARQLIILDPTAAKLLRKVRLRSTPALLAATGLYDVEYRIVAACRDGRIYTMRGGEVLATVIELEAPPVGLVIANSLIHVAQMDGALHAFHYRGKKAFSLYLPAPVLDMAPVVAKSRAVNAVMVALANKEVRLYNGKQLVSTITLPDVTAGLVFGRYGREDNALLTVLRSGGLQVRILPRSAKLEGAVAAGPPPEQDRPLDVPKKTRLYVEQTQREREHATDMHRVFQRDLCKLRLTTARAFVKIATDSQGPLSVSAGATVRLIAKVAGMGPAFRLQLLASNAGSRPVADVALVVTADPARYRVAQPLLLLPLLVPSLTYTVETDVLCVEPQLPPDTLRVYAVMAGSAVPLITALVNMPLSELPLEV